MKKRTPEEMERAHVIKTQRTLIRLKHSLAADEEINSTMPDSVEEFDRALANGDLRTAKARIDEALAD